MGRTRLFALSDYPIRTICGSLMLVPQLFHRRALTIRTLAQASVSPDPLVKRRMWPSYYSASRTVVY
jgi:hypothetical protein